LARGIVESEGWNAKNRARKKEGNWQAVMLFALNDG
jgi:hypothetical protein